MISDSYKLLLLSLCIGVSGCSFIVDLDECKSNSDCTKKYGNAAVCSSGICEVSTIKSKQCQEVLGDPTAPNTLTIGAVLSFSGDEAAFGLPLKNAITVAYNDFAKVKIDGRDVAVVFCDDVKSIDEAKKAVEHLVNVVKVPAIIGPEYSDFVKDLLKITKPAGVVMVSPTATAEIIGTLDDDNLVWRTSPTDLYQAAAIGKLLGSTKSALEKASKPTSKIWLLTAGNGIYTGGLRDRLIKSLPKNIDAKDLVNLNYPEEDFSEFFNKNLASKDAPNIVVIFGFAEVWDLANTIDDKFRNTEDGKNTIFIFADGSLNQKKASKSPNLKQRVLGTAPQAVGNPDYLPYSTFRSKYVAEGYTKPDQAAFLPHAYDAFYVIGLAAGANGVTGKDIAKGLSRLSKGTKIGSDRQGIEEAFSILRKSKDATVNYQGASGRVDFDENGDPNRAPISLWCLTKNGIENAPGILLNEDGDYAFDDDTIFADDGCLKSLVTQ